MMTDQRNFELAIDEEKRYPQAAAASYGMDAAKMMRGDFKPEVPALYARIAGHFGRVVMRTYEEVGLRVPGGLS